MRFCRRSLPETWQEIPAERRVLVLKKLLVSDKNEALRLATGIRKRLWRKIPVIDKEALLQKCKWATLTPDTKAIFPSFTYKGRTYHMPADQFTNAACVEYPLADEYLESFVNDGNLKSLLYLVATLCRPANPDLEAARRRDDLRLPLHSRMEVEQNAAALAGLPYEIQLSVLMYFTGVKTLVHKLYGSWLFEQPDPEEEQPEQAKKKDPLGWWGMYMDAAGGDITKLEEIHQSNFHTFCTMEVRRRKQAKEMMMQQRLQSKDFGNPDAE